jgi:hypothetical protein
VTIMHSVFIIHISVIGQLSGSLQAVIRQSSGSHQAVIKQSSGSYQEVIRQTSDSYQTSISLELNQKFLVLVRVPSLGHHLGHWILSGKLI